MYGGTSKAVYELMTSLGTVLRREGQQDCQYIMVYVSRTDNLTKSVHGQLRGPVRPIQTMFVVVVGFTTPSTIYGKTCEHSMGG